MTKRGEIKKGSKPRVAISVVTNKRRNVIHRSAGPNQRPKTVFYREGRQRDALGMREQKRCLAHGEEQKR